MHPVCAFKLPRPNHGRSVRDANAPWKVSLRARCHPYNVRDAHHDSRRAAPDLSVRRLRLTDARTGREIDYWAQKQIIVEHFDRAALVGFYGIVHTGRQYVPEWIVQQLRALSQDTAFEDSAVGRRLVRPRRSKIPSNHLLRGSDRGVQAHLRTNLELRGDRSTAATPSAERAALDVNRFRPKKRAAVSFRSPRRSVGTMGTSRLPPSRTRLPPRRTRSMRQQREIPIRMAKLGARDRGKHEGVSQLRSTEPFTKMGCARGGVSPAATTEASTRAGRRLRRTRARPYGRSRRCTSAAKTRRAQPSSVRQLTLSVASADSPPTRLLFTSGALRTVAPDGRITTADVPNHPHSITPKTTTKSAEPVMTRVGDRLARELVGAGCSGSCPSAPGVGADGVGGGVRSAPQRRHSWRSGAFGVLQAGHGASASSTTVGGSGGGSSGPECCHGCRCGLDWDLARSVGGSLHPGGVIGRLRPAPVHRLTALAEPVGVIGELAAAAVTLKAHQLFTSLGTRPSALCNSDAVSELSSVTAFSASCIAFIVFCAAAAGVGSGLLGAARVRRLIGKEIKRCEVDEPLASPHTAISTKRTMAILIRAAGIQRRQTSVALATSGVGPPVASKVSRRRFSGPVSGRDALTLTFVVAWAYGATSSVVFSNANLACPSASRPASASRSGALA